MKYKIIIILLSLLVSFAIEAQNCFISEGKEWTVDGMMYGSDDTCIRFTNKHKISQVENVDGKIIAILQAKSWRAATEFEPSEWSGNVVITECDDKLYIGERLVFDMGLQVGDRFVWSEEQAWENMTVTGIDYREIEGVKRKCIYLCCAEDPNITDIWIEGIGSMIYGIENEPLMKVGASTKMISCIENGIEVYSDEPLDYEYTPLVEEGKVWYYTESWGWLAVIDNARVAMRGQDEINGKVYTKCWLYYDHCEFSEDDAMLLCYMREEDKRVYMIPAVDSEHCPSFFLGYESYASDIADAQEYLLYDFNLSAGDSYCEVPDYNNEWLYHTIESVDFIEIDGKLRKKYVLSNSHNVIEGIGIIGDFSGYVCSPNPVLLTYEYTTPRLSHITLDNETIFLYYGGDPCLSNDDPNTIKVEKIGDLTLYQTGDVVTIGGAIGKVNVAIYTFDGMKVAEASGSESVSLSTAELPIGIYVVKATDSTGNKLIQKIVIK